MKHIPNMLSIFRICLIPFFVWQMVVGNWTTSAVILLVSGLTDLLDGYLARRNNWVSQLGKVLDPAADKLTQVTVCIVLAVKLRALWPFFLILLVKDAIMLLLGGQLIRRGVKLEGAKWFGKVTTTLFYGTMVIILFFPAMPQWITVFLLSVTVISAIATAIMYIPEYLNYKRIAKEEQGTRAADAEMVEL